MRFRMMMCLSVCTAHSCAAQLRLVNEPVPAFDGIDQLADPMPGAPADPDIAVGEQCILQVVNGVIAWWMRADVDITDSMMLNSFHGLSQSPMSFGTDPRAIFDPDSKRFVATAYGLVPGKLGRQICVAISPPEEDMISAGQPLQGWTHFSLQGFWQSTGAHTHPCATGDGILGGLSVDQPLLGMTDDAWIITAFIAPLDPDDPADYVVYVIDKEDFTVAGPLFVSQVFRDDDGEPLGCIAGTRGVGLPRPTKGGGRMLLVGVEPSTVVPAGSSTALRLFSLEDPFGTRRTSTITIDLDTAIAEPPCAPTPAFPDQPPLHALDARIQSAALRDDELLIALCTSVAIDDVIEAETSRAAISWMTIDTRGWPASGLEPIIAEQGVIAPPSAGSPSAPVHTFFPAGAMNAAGDMAIVHARSSATTNASVAAWGRSAAGEVSPPLTARTSPFADTPDDLYLGTCARWGDYFDIELDPLDDTFWGVGMYMKTPDAWGSWIFHFELATP